MQATMDYYAGRWRSKSMLDVGLARLDRLRGEARDELSANNPHELYRCIEVLSLMDCAEAIMLSARAREESRFGPEHSRADYPNLDDEWYCNTAMKKGKDRFLTYKKPFNHIYR